MKKADVKVGGKYYAKVSNQRVEVRIDAEREAGGWDATNLSTGKKVCIKSAQRLQGAVGGRTKAKATEAKAAIKPSEAKPTKAKVAKPAKPTDGKKLSAIDAAAKVLGEAKQPMNCKELIEAMTTKGLWTSPGGKTPWATLYSAITREINVKGKESRFAKADRGKFTLA
jgi:hypothetical protein